MFDKTIYFVSNILLSNKTRLCCCHMGGFVPVRLGGRRVEEWGPAVCPCCPVLLLQAVPGELCRLGVQGDELSPPALPAPPSRVLQAQAATPKYKGRVVCWDEYVFFSYPALTSLL